MTRRSAIRHLIFGVCLSIAVSSSLSACSSADCSSEDACRASGPEPVTSFATGTPWTPGSFQFGLVLDWSTIAAGGPDAAAVAGHWLDYAEYLGANSVAITFPIQMESTTSSRVEAGAHTPPPEVLATVVDEAVTRSLRSTIVPTVVVGTGGANQDINPGNTDAWFNAYRDLLSEYATRLERTGLTEFTIGNGLPLLQKHTMEWAELLSALEKDFTGQFGYTMNWDTPSSEVPTTAYGINAYPSLNASDLSTPNAVADALADWIKTIPAPIRRSLTIQRTGIAPHSGAFANPSDSSAAGPTDINVQVNWIAGIVAAARKMGLQGVYLEGIDGSGPRSFSGSPSESAVMSAFGKATAQPS